MKGTRVLGWQMRGGEEENLYTYTYTYVIYVYMYIYGETEDGR